MVKIPKTLRERVKTSSKYASDPSKSLKIDQKLKNRIIRRRENIPTPRGRVRNVFEWKKRFILYESKRSANEFWEWF